MLDVLHLNEQVLLFIFFYSFDSNSLRDKGAGMLAKALKMNQSLQNLRSVTDIYTWHMPYMPGGTYKLM